MLEPGAMTSRLVAVVVLAWCSVVHAQGIGGLLKKTQPQATVTLRRIKQQLVAHRDGDDRQLLGD